MVTGVPSCLASETEATGDMSLSRTVSSDAGDVHVDGVVYGKLATPPDAADYAEWFAWVDEYVGGVASLPDRAAPHAAEAEGTAAEALDVGPPASRAAAKE